MAKLLGHAAAQAHGLLYLQVRRHFMMLAFADDFWLSGITFQALIPLMFLMKKVKPDLQSHALPLF